MFDDNPIIKKIAIFFGNRSILVDECSVFRELEHQSIQSRVFRILELVIDLIFNSSGKGLEFCPKDRDLKL